MQKENCEKINKLNGIIEIKGSCEIYKSWSLKSIYPLIINIIKEKYPDSLVLPELNDIDLTIIDNKTDNIIPVEIQKTPISSNKFRHATFEDSIRRQLEDNIENYEKCWFFLDSEYLRYMQTETLRKNININMRWIINLMKKEKLKVFSIKYDGVVKELSINDFGFIEKLYPNDVLTLNVNKSKIFHNIINGYNFGQDEINQFYDNSKFTKTCNGYGEDFIKNGNERCKLYGYLLNIINGRLNIINSCLDMKSYNSHIRIYLRQLGFFEDYNKFVDKFDICKYFPGYMRKEKIWLNYKGNNIGNDMFHNLCIGRFVKDTKSVFDY